MLVGAFSGNPDSLIDKIVKKIQEENDFVISNIYGVIRDDGRNLELSKDGLLAISYADRRIHLLFNLWYTFNYTPAYIQNEPQVDHVFPQSILKIVKDYNPDSGRMSLMRYKQPLRDQLANMMLLSRQENGAGGKGATSAEDWFADKDQQYLDLHLIPNDPELWKLENYERFIEERKKLIIAKFDYLLIRS
ncbi:GmrSD restriction endonuclease domain-containing protein [Puia sp. P3]|uniref:GmrSD restriction endonuclease domain-containing protein n=1 Tax=Puia sp. P3 TaxID=3423952 RepID=UPI003D66DC73